MRILALGGVAGPAIFSVAMLVTSALRRDYSHLSSFISELGANGTPYAALMNYGGFVPAGVLLAAFGVGLGSVMPRRRLTTVAAGLVTLFGCGVAASGIISCDPGCPQATGSVENLIHDRIGPASFLCLIAGVALFGIAFRGIPAWRHLLAYSFLTSASALCLLVALASSLDTRELTGLWQRLLLAVLFQWCVVIGLKAYRYDTGGPSRQRR
jgi:hypothetical membrane protein